MKDATFLCGSRSLSSVFSSSCENRPIKEVFCGCHAGEAESSQGYMDAHGTGLFVRPVGALTPETVAVPRQACLSWPLNFSSLYFPSSSLAFPATTTTGGDTLAAVTHLHLEKPSGVMRLRLNRRTHSFT